MMRMPTSRSRSAFQISVDRIRSRTTTALAVAVKDVSELTRDWVKDQARFVKAHEAAAEVEITIRYQRRSESCFHHQPSLLQFPKRHRSLPHCRLPEWTSIPRCGKT